MELKGKKLVNIGTSIIDPQKFSEVKNFNVKPCGGLWTSCLYDIYNSCSWLEFLYDKTVYEHSDLLYRKYGDIMDEQWNIPAVAITLKNNTRVLNVDSDNIKPFMEIDGSICFELMGLYYDVVNIDLFKIRNAELFAKLKSFDIDNTQIIYNLDCIDYYQKAQARLHPNNLEDCKIEISPEKQYIEKGQILQRNKKSI